MRSAAASSSTATCTRAGGSVSLTLISEAILLSITLAIRSGALSSIDSRVTPKCAPVARSCARRSLKS